MAATYNDILAMSPIQRLAHACQPRPRRPFTEAEIKRMDDQEALRIERLREAHRQGVIRSRTLRAARRTYIQAKWNKRCARNRYFAVQRAAGPMTAERFDALAQCQLAQALAHREMELAGAVWLPELARQRQRIAERRELAGAL